MRDEQKCKLVEPQLDEHGVIARDYTCFECDYNLRGMAATGACPECGSAVAGTIESRWNVVANVLHLGHFSIADRIGYALFGIVLPAVCCAIAVTAPVSFPGSQEEHVQHYAALLYAGLPLLVFYPLLGYAMVSLAVFLIRPLHAVKYATWRWGVISGVILAVQYLLLLCVALTGTGAVVPFAFACGCIAGVLLMTRAARRGWAAGQLRDRRKYARIRKRILLAAVVAFAILLGIVQMKHGAAFEVLYMSVVIAAMLALACAPAIALLIYFAMYERIRETWNDMPVTGFTPFSLFFVWLVVWLATWAVAILLIFEWF